MGGAVDRHGSPVTAPTHRPAVGAFFIRCGLLYRRGQGEADRLCVPDGGGCRHAYCRRPSLSLYSSLSLSCSLPLPLPLSLSPSFSPSPSPSPSLSLSRSLSLPLPLPLPPPSLPPSLSLGGDGAAVARGLRRRLLPTTRPSVDTLAGTRRRRSSTVSLSGRGRRATCGLRAVPRGLPAHQGRSGGPARPVAPPPAPL